MSFVYIYYYLYFTNLECDAGKFGPHCETVCPYSFNGNLSAFKCYCNADLCNLSDGCSGNDILVTLTLLVFNYSLINYLCHEYAFITLLHLRAGLFD